MLNPPDTKCSEMNLPLINKYKPAKLHNKAIFKCTYIAATIMAESDIIRVRTTVGETTHENVLSSLPLHTLAILVYSQNIHV